MSHQEESGKMGTRAYPAVIKPYTGGVWVDFYDLAGCYAEGETFEDAMKYAEAALGAYLTSRMERGIDIPAATEAQAVNRGFWGVTVFEVDLDALKNGGGMDGGAISHYYPGRQ